MIKGCPYLGAVPPLDSSTMKQPYISQTISLMLEDPKPAREATVQVDDMSKSENNLLLWRDSYRG
jgi:hypothetical protein